MTAPYEETQWLPSWRFLKEKAADVMGSPCSCSHNTQAGTTRGDESDDHQRDSNMAAAKSISKAIPENLDGRQLALCYVARIEQTLPILHCSIPPAVSEGSGTILIIDRGADLIDILIHGCPERLRPLHIRSSRCQSAAACTHFSYLRAGGASTACLPLVFTTCEPQQPRTSLSSFMGLLLEPKCHPPSPQQDASRLIAKRHLTCACATLLIEMERGESGLDGLRILHTELCWGPRRPQQRCWGYPLQLQHVPGS